MIVFLQLWAQTVHPVSVVRLWMLICQIISLVAICHLHLGVITWIYPGYVFFTPISLPGTFHCIH